ncbi:MAG TPA: tetratricopeptide repeat protein [Candidatus Hydrogenedentes bacterium]|jgi:tetratricopeptide (TPR) repeat protein|nr:MAG: Tetratricopeptide repeat protein [Candidatus Hydrogenedentes bacterium ADurb.Bin170]HNZ48272.1 tetratricopeptide repeat protein [Candidatus Hydrogenedentota bacterium]HOH42033.1 tetratricopeptide repeat protein [Candidatus Hydrogenedentota bacterium]HOM47447.1 tetratricopeptide repeat protein [Candidatus Hydrogenedentota bacterium]HOR49845.1 tetratricopeptide repeat protein [Candidatus Hydrogenedentota bacterium]
MKRYSYWLVVATVAFIALLVVGWRYLDPPNQGFRIYTKRMVSYTLELLENDPTVQLPETRACVRLVAASAEASWLNTPEALYILALQYERENSTENAELWFREVIRLAPGWSWPYVNLGILLARTDAGRLEEAAELLTAAIALQPDWVRPYNSLSVVLRSLGRLEEAEAMAIAAITLEPQDVAAHNNYANLLAVMGRYEEAEEHYRYAMENAPENSKPPYNLACLYCARGLDEEALDYLAFAITLSSDARLDAASDPCFSALRDNPYFQELIYGEPEAVPAEETGLEEGAASEPPEETEADAEEGDPGESTEASEHE